MGEWRGKIIVILKGVFEIFWGKGGLYIFFLHV